MSVGLCSMPSQTIHSISMKLWCVNVLMPEVVYAKENFEKFQKMIYFENLFWKKKNNVNYYYCDDHNKCIRRNNFHNIFLFVTSWPGPASRSGMKIEENLFEILIRLYFLFSIRLTISKVFLRTLLWISFAHPVGIHPSVIFAVISSSLERLVWFYANLIIRTLEFRRCACMFVYVNKTETTDSRTDTGTHQEALRSACRQRALSLCVRESPR